MSGSEEWDRRAQQKQKDAEEIAKALSSFINSASDEEYQLLANEILRDHRTLQQKTFGFMLTTIKAWADLEDNRFDLRNQATVEKCREIVKYLGEYGLKLPCI